MDVNRTANYSMTDLLPDSFFEGVILSFSLSVVIGIVIGSFFWIIFTCLARRKQASASISPGTSLRNRSSSHNVMLTRTGFYRSNSYDRHGDNNLALASTLAFQRQASQDQADTYGRKSTFRASTFHPFAETPLADGLDRMQSSSGLLGTNTSSTLNCGLGYQEQHWSEAQHYDCHSSQTPPPAYDFVVEPSKESLP
ncbi:myc target protein 1 homolog [Stegostoma tigrinum]|uniref:myc target protein 1 homolog n=1 Tax=Stegostoma tigrinum TaxID=3053191 RepID=UPI00202B1353|nr:myc target protein 1 homolog [Stegostoma tigrinum]